MSTFDGGVPLAQSAQPILDAKFRTPDVVELGSAADLVNEAQVSAWEEGFDLVEFGPEVGDELVMTVGVAPIRVLF